jgi:hypothetical protein
MCALISQTYGPHWDHCQEERVCVYIYRLTGENSWDSVLTCGRLRIVRVRGYLKFY